MQTCCSNPSTGVPQLLVPKLNPLASCLFSIAYISEDSTSAPAALSCPLCSRFIFAMSSPYAVNSGAGPGEKWACASGLLAHLHHCQNEDQ
jgi:hypothetical protein